MNEMSLRDFLEVVWSAKWIIAIIVSICLIFGAVYAVFVMDSSFRAEVLFEVSPLNENPYSSIFVKNSASIDFLTLQPNASPEMYLEKIRGPKVLDSAINELESVYGLSYSIKDLKSRISINAPKNTTYIYIQAVDENSENAINIANSVSDSFIKFTRNAVMEYAENTIITYEEHLQEEETDIAEILVEIAEFEAVSNGVDAMKDDLANKKYILNSHARDLIALEISIKTNSTGLEMAVNLLSDTSPFITVVKAIGDDAMLAEAQNEDGSYDLSKLSDNIIIEQVVNPESTKLASMVSEYRITLAMEQKKKEILISDIELMEKEIDMLSKNLMTAESKYKSISNRLNIAEKARDEYQIKLKSAVDFQNAGIGENSIRLISPAVSAAQEGKSKAFVILLSVIAGLMIGLFAAFIKNALKSEKESEKTT